MTHYESHFTTDHSKNVIRTQSPQYTNRQRRANVLRQFSALFLARHDPKLYALLLEQAQAAPRPQNICRQRCLEYVRSNHPGVYAKLVSTAKQLFPVQNPWYVGHAAPIICVARKSR